MVVCALATSVIAVVLTLSASVCLSKPPSIPIDGPCIRKRTFGRDGMPTARPLALDNIVYADYRGLNIFQTPRHRVCAVATTRGSLVRCAPMRMTYSAPSLVLWVVGTPTLRFSAVYEKTVRVAWLLAHDGRFLIATGGGPGQMEAANLGAYLANYGADNIDQALKLLRTNIDRDPVTRKVRWSDKQECKYLDDKMQDDKFTYTARPKAGSRQVSKWS